MAKDKYLTFLRKKKQIINLMATSLEFFLIPINIMQKDNS